MVSTRRTNPKQEEAAAKKESQPKQKRQSKAKPQPPKPPASKKKASRPAASSSASVATAVSGATSTASARRGLPLWVIKTIATDIQRETQGKGPSALGKGKTLQRILDKRPLTYGVTGTDRRRQISNLVDKWKNFSRDAYNSRVLLKFSVPVHPEPDETLDVKETAEQEVDNKQQEVAANGEPEDCPPIPTVITTTKQSTKGDKSTQNSKAASNKAGSSQAPKDRKETSATKPVIKSPPVIKKIATANMSVSFGSPIRFVRGTQSVADGKKQLVPTIGPHLR